MNRLDIKESPVWPERMTHKQSNRPLSQSITE